MAEHFVHAHNRAQAEMKMSETPEVFASPQRLADEANVARNKLIAEQHAAHARAEKAWGSQTLWSRIWIACIVASSAGFVFGIVWPLIQLSLGRTLLP